MENKKQKFLLLKWLGLFIFIVGIYFIVRQINNDNFSQNITIKTLPAGENILSSSENVKVYNDDNQEINFDTEQVNDILPSSINHIFIKKIGVNAKILQGGEEQLAKGIWLLPRTSTPDKGKNTVISAHRWKFKPPDKRTFYNLDKMETGDIAIIWWNNKKYTYQVSKIKIVTPDQTDILYPSKEPRLTLFSCTPLYKTTHRLVVVADLIKTE